MRISSKYIVFHSKWHPLCSADLSISLSGSTFEPVDHVRNLGAMQDKCLTMEKHVNSVARSCYHQIHLISKIRNYITTDACKALVQSLVTTRLDYANVLLHGVPSCLLQRLKRVQNSAARLISGSSRREHITPILISLHWLPVEFRLKYKVLLHTFKALHNLSPGYISDMVEWYQPARALRSAGQSLLEVKYEPRNSYGRRSFRFAAPALWNALPLHIRQAESLFTFKRKLKTHFFKEAYGL